MRVRVWLPLLLFVLAPIPARAGLIESLTGGSTAGTPIAGGFIYDVLGSEACAPAMIHGCPRFVPIQSLELTLGDHVLTLADASLELPAVGQVGLPDRLIAGTSQVESEPFSISMIPGPSSLIVGVGGAIMGLALRVRKRSRISVA